MSASEDQLPRPPAARMAITAGAFEWEFLCVRQDFERARRMQVFEEHRWVPGNIVARENVRGSDESPGRMGRVF